jgi:hypothetical protein
MYEVAADGTLTGYYVNDLTHSQSQGGVTNTYGLDAALRQRERITEGGLEEGTEVYHYAGELGVPADVVVASEGHVRAWGELPGTVIHDALTEGRIVSGRVSSRQ